MKERRHSNIRRQAGNVIVILAFLLTGLLAVAGFAIDSTVYLLKRQELQSLAESVAIGAALSLPNRSAAQKAAADWYRLLRVDGDREMAPSIEADPEAFNVEFDDNIEEAGETVPYLVRSVKVRIRLDYEPKVFPVFHGSIGIVGEASAQIRPTDVVLVIDNSASWLNPINRTLPTFTKVFGAEPGERFLAQCFAEPFAQFKESIVRLFDSLSQIQTIRTGVVFSSSKTGSPYVFSDLGQLTLGSSDLPYDEDEPWAPTTRCAAATSLSDFQVPAPLPSADIWSPRSSLAKAIKPSGSGLFELRSGETLLTREALWITPAGTSTESGFIPPRYYYQDLDSAIALARTMLTDSRRPDGIEVAARSIIVLTDDPGKLPGESAEPSICRTWGGKLRNDKIMLGVAALSHTGSVYGHDPRQGSGGKAFTKLREDCSSESGEHQAAFLLEHTALTNKTEPFADRIVPFTALGLKQVELRR